MQNDAANMIFLLSKNFSGGDFPTYSNITLIYTIYYDACMFVGGVLTTITV